MTNRPTKLCLAAALVCASCGDGTGPAAPFSKFDLVRYADEPVPVTLVVLVQFPTTPDGPAVTCEHKLASMRVELGDGGRYTLTTGRTIVCDDGRPDERSSTVETGSYTVSADTVHMTASLPPEETAAGVAREYSAIRSPLELRMYSRYSASGAFATTDYRPLIFQAAR